MNFAPPGMMGMGPPSMMGGGGMPFMPMIRKPDFPQDMQTVFVIPQIAHIKSQIKPKCRPYEPVLQRGREAEWMLEKFDDEYEQEQHFKKEEAIVRPSRVAPKLIRKMERVKRHQEVLHGRLQKWNPFEDPNIQSDPYKTLIISRLSYQTNEKKLRKEFEAYGAIKSVTLVKNTTSEKLRGYAFIEFEHKNDLKTAYKYAEGKRIDGKRVVVDFEKGRTVLKWRPRRLGGGLGDTRRSRSEELRSKEDDRRDRQASEESEKAVKNKHRSISRERNSKRAKGTLAIEKDEGKHKKQRGRSRSEEKRKQAKPVHDDKKDKKHKKHKKKHDEEAGEIDLQQNDDNGDEMRKRKKEKKDKKTSEKKKKRKD